jgi:hypothetical protein
MTMKTFEKTAAQGDVVFRVVDSIPDDVREVPPQGGVHIVAHSETGHHHIVRAAGVSMFEAPGNPLVAYLRCAPGVDFEVEHQRDFDTHAPLRRGGNTNGPTVIEVRRQREWAPEGWRRAVD